MEFFWILIFSFANAMTAVGIDKKPMFYALDNPCMDQYRLCSTACTVITLKNDVQCQFCYCNDSNNNIAWPSTKTQTSSIPRTTTAAKKQPLLPTTVNHLSPTTPSPYLTVNNITYVTLSNPCSPTKAMCPVRCKMTNITVNSRVCETCNCENIFPKIFGKRFEEHIVEVNLQKQEKIPKLAKEYTDTKRINKKRCISFFCPLVRCPSGQNFEMGPDGCRMCRCTNFQNPDKSLVTKTKSSNLINQSGSKPDASELFCMPTPNNCPSNCHLQNITVDFWKCYFCRCPQGTRNTLDGRNDAHFVAMVNPCNYKQHLCPSNCTVRQLQSSVILGSVTCDYCDCKTKKTDLERNARMIVNTFKPEDISTTVHCLNLPSDCPFHCHLTSVHSKSWNCHVCVCNGVLIPKQFIHHFNTVFKQSTTPSYSTNKHTNHLMTATVLVTQDIKLHPSLYPTQTVKVPDPLPTSGNVLSKGQTSSHLHSTLPLSTNSPEVSISCFICNGTQCGDKDLQLCSKDKKFCMNSFIQYQDGTKKITRGCVTEDECNREWWLKTADDPVCLTLDNEANIDTDDKKECNFCCTNNGCNKNLRMRDHVFIGK